MKTQFRNNFHSMSIKCIFANKSFVTLQMGYGGVGGRGQGVTQDAFDKVIGAFDRVYQRRFDSINGGKKFENNGEFMQALNDKLAADNGIADPVTLAQKIEAFAA